MRKKRWDEASQLLEELDRHYPNRTKVLAPLVNTYYELQNIESYQAAIERLVQAVLLSSLESGKQQNGTKPFRKLRTIYNCAGL